MRDKNVIDYDAIIIRKNVWMTLIIFRSFYFNQKKISVSIENRKKKLKKCH